MDKSLTKKLRVFMTLIIQLILLDEIESDNYVSKFEAKFKNEESRKKNDSEIKNKSKVIETNKLVSLDTIFKKTKTKPCLYYLPLTDEEVYFILFR